MNDNVQVIYDNDKLVIRAIKNFTAFPIKLCLQREEVEVVSNVESDVSRYRNDSRVFVALMLTRW